MKRFQILALIIILVIGSVAVVITKPTKKGLDLAGGVRVVLQAETSQLQKGETWNPSEDLPGIVRVIRNRVDVLGVSEPVIQPKGSDQIIVELPDEDNVEEAVAQLQGTARMEFRHLKDVQDKRHASAKYKMISSKDEQGNDTYEFIDAQGNTVATKDVLADSTLIMTGDDILPNSKATTGSNYDMVVALEFNNEGRKKFAEFTRRNVDEYLAVVLEGKILSAPVIKVPILDGKAVIEGTFTAEEAQRLGEYINAGALPVPLSVVQSQKVEATLGQQAVDSSIKAGIGGLILVMLFMFMYYLMPGVIANIALIIYALLSFAVFKLIPVTLTLPGIAAFILSIGMAVDANILIFERLKEELRSGKTLKAAIDAGFSRAFTSIFDSNMCTAITCTILLYFGTGPIKGFALVLLIGVIISMFTAITVTRSILHLIVNTGLATHPKWFGVRRQWVTGDTGNTGTAGRQVDIVGRMKVWFLISAVLLIPGLIMLGKGELKGGIDFTGGNMYQVEFNQPVTSPQIDEALAGVGLTNNVIQGTKSDTTEKPMFFIRTKDIPFDKSAEVKSAITAIGGSILSEDHVGASISKELTTNAIWAVIFASIAIVLYLTIRFAVGGIKTGFRFGVCAVAALLHDVGIILGAFAIFGYFLHWEVDSLFVTALLTIIGFSVHDTIVIFDRIRENMKHRVRGEEFDSLVNKSILQSFARSINTSLTVVLTLAALLFFGAPSIRQFVIALLIGIIAGTYSSIFNASQLLVMWDRLVRKDSAQGTVTETAKVSAVKARDLKPVAVVDSTVGNVEESAEEKAAKAKSASSSKKRKKRF
ncbi:MAG: protein translocase subunit SecD [Armatimonadota bacterium]